MADPISVALTTAAHLRSIISLIQEEKIRSEVFQAVSGLQERLMDVQREAFDLIAKNRELVDKTRELEMKLAEREAWKEKQARYRKAEVVPGVIVYVIDQPANAVDAASKYCPQCVMKQMESLLQRSSQSAALYECHNCGFKYRDDSVGGAESVRAIRRPRDRGLEI